MIYELMKDEVNLGKKNMNMSQLEGRNSSGNKSPVGSLQSPVREKSAERMAQIVKWKLLNVISYMLNVRMLRCMI